MLTSKFTNKSVNNFLQIILTLTLHVLVNIMYGLYKNLEKPEISFLLQVSI